ncbi:MAG TPA: hypothetical protein PK735_01310 [Flavobacteriales bacterium]|nr:hypothetical protein [Flavobacteriales bacterium]
MNSKAFIRLAIAKTIQYNIAVDLTGEHIDPFYNSERHKVKGVLVRDSITCAHVRVIDDKIE